MKIIFYWKRISRDLTEHAHGINVSCCLIMFCIAPKASVQENVSVHEKILILGSKQVYAQDTHFPRKMVPTLDS